jgi:hypothetical protein
MSTRLLERVHRHAFLGLRFWDVAAASASIDALEVEVYPRARPRARSRASINRSGVYVAQGIAGMRDLEFANPDLGDADPWSAAARPYRVEVRDPRGRFLPMAFDADLPARGLFTWRAPWFSPPRAISLPGEAGSPPQLLIEKIPLFPAPQRPVPEPLAVVYAQLRESGAERPAAWAAVTASVGGEVRGLGVADDEGRVAVMFPYPEPPRLSLSSPPQARSEFHWQVELQAYYRVGSPPAAAPEIADLGDVLSQLELPPRPLLGSAPSPSLPLGPLPLEYRGRLTARTEATPAGPSSFLFVSTA